VGVFLLFLGFAVNTLAGLVIIVKAFKVSVGWGLAVMFIPFAGLFFIIKNWEDTKTPFLVGIGGGVLMLIGIFTTAMTTPDETPTVASQSASEEDEVAQTSYASAAATPASYEPPRSSYAPTTTHTPSYVPPPVPGPAPVATATETQEAEDLWTRKPKLEQVYVDRDTNMYYGAKCKKLPENVYRLPKTLALAQGFAEAKCR
jgi:hypothetical protein